MKRTGFLVTVVVLFIFSAYVSWSLYFKNYVGEETVNIHTFPKTIGEWDSVEMELSETELAILETENAFVRRYFTDDGREVFLFIVYSEKNRKVSHPPEICYTGAGAAILDNEFVSFESQYKGEPVKITGNMMTVEIGRFDQNVFYWFKVGDDFTSNYWKQQGLIAMKSFFNQPSSSAMVRISAMVDSSDGQDSKQVISEFASKVTPLLAQHLP